MLKNRKVTTFAKCSFDGVKNEFSFRFEVSKYQHGFLSNCFNNISELFEFNEPPNRDLTETVSILAHLSRFIVADLTDARSIAQELQAIVPNLLSVPVKPLLLSSQRAYGMFEHIQRYPQVLEIEFYDDIDALLSSLTVKVIDPAEAKATELANRKLG